MTKRRRAWASCKGLLVKWWRWAVVALLVIGVAYALYWWPCSGFGGYCDAEGKWQRGKTLWDWMDLLIVPALLGIGAYALNRTVTRRTRERELDQSLESAWQEYLEHMAKLLLEKELRESGPDAEVRSVAKARTLATLRQLDRKRKGYLVQFLYDSQLIKKDNPVVTLDKADLSEIDLFNAHLKDSNLEGAYLEGADLSFADLSEAYLNGTTLNNAILHGTVLIGAHLSDSHLLKADLRGADLTNTILCRAKVTDEQLNQAATHDGATLPNDANCANFPPYSAN